MWALIAGGFMFVTAIIFSLGKASSKREEAADSHREELLARSKDSTAEKKVIETRHTQPIEQPTSHKENKTPHPSEQL
ncbi:hypothetical protein A1A1_12682 [Planococcus antarcticus DSM 14505]|uniref:Uncharacterized protein n=1 Tax=Planococcus antarcticus DSM 14505 TaxID=1185653 RepID=A0A1C7DFX8_9BACL|nr:hypothetical protein [Planococcus antarcticus]ANU10171.1 hypothetical protein BBH88_07585 [Planococcus antarcticus DSM 14505]EIM06120.1 hypothetical protein A1A1_12682 [Planococcus antarcticus DSM 14505]